MRRISWSQSPEWAIGGCWIGASLRKGLSDVVPAGIGYRISAVPLMLLAGGVSAHVFR